MNSRRRKPAVLLTGLLLLLLAGSMEMWLRSAQRQYALNRQLIAALVKGDDNRALVLVNEGADPNAYYEPTPKPTLSELVKQLFHHSARPIKQPTTAFTIACGLRVFWWEGNDKVYGRCPHNVRLVQAMILHGAQVNSQDEEGMTPLMVAVSQGQPDVDMVGCLLKHGAIPNTQDDGGRTALLFAIGVHTNIGIVRQLITYGADPNLADGSGGTALKAAQEEHRPDVVTLLKQYRARK